VKANCSLLRITWILENVLLLAFATVSSGQLGDSSYFSLGYAETGDDSTGVDVGVAYEPSLAEFTEFGDNYAIVMTPSINYHDGSDGIPNSIILKMTGNIIFFKTMTLQDIIVPDTRYFSVIPVSIGIETEKTFQTINAIGEVGYIPWYWTSHGEQGMLSWLASQSRIAVYLQGGYKFEIDEASPGDTTASSGSQEEPDHGLFRLKGSARFEPTLVTFGSFLGVSLFGTGDIWWDVLNSELYHQAIAGLRFTLYRTTFVDLKYESGSGAPLFLDGNQVGIDLGVSL
jgi:hypothetical protein